MTQREYVRVKDNDTEHEISVLRSRYERDKDLFTLLDKPAAHPSGAPLAPKHKTTVARKAAASKRAASQAKSKTTDSPEPGEKAETPATDKEN